VRESLGWLRMLAEAVRRNEARRAALACEVAGGAAAAQNGEGRPLRGLHGALVKRAGGE